MDDDLGLCLFTMSNMSASVPSGPLDETSAMVRACPVIVPRTLPYRADALVDAEESGTQTDRVGVVYFQYRVPATE